MLELSHMGVKPDMGTVERGVAQGVQWVVLARELVWGQGAPPHSPMLE